MACESIERRFRVSGNTYSFICAKAYGSVITLDEDYPLQVLIPHPYIQEGLDNYL
jgi:hypothetical protein